MKSLTEEELDKLDPIGMADYVDQKLREVGMWTPKIGKAIERVKEECRAIESEVEGLSDYVKDFKFHMEYKDRIDKVFDELYRVSKEEGIVL